jgi:hypothetical protein
LQSSERSPQHTQCKQGLSKREIIRCLKRYVGRDLLPIIKATAKDHPDLNALQLRTDFRRVDLKGFEPPTFSLRMPSRHAATAMPRRG